MSSSNHPNPNSNPNLTSFRILSSPSSPPPTIPIFKNPYAPIPRFNRVPQNTAQNALQNLTLNSNPSHDPSFTTLSPITQKFVMSQHLRHRPLDATVLDTNEKFSSFERAWKGFWSWKEVMMVGGYHGSGELSRTENVLLDDVLQSFNTFIEAIGLRARLKDFSIPIGLKGRGDSNPNLNSNLVKAEGLELKLKGNPLVAFVKKAMERPRPGISDFFDIARREVDPENGRPQELRDFLNRRSECVSRTGTGTGLGMDSQVEVQVPKPVIEDSGRWWDIPANLMVFKGLKDGFEKVLEEILKDLGWGEVRVRE